MDSMKSKMPLILFSILILLVGYLPNVQAVTDAELEALEKQIEQQETKEQQHKAELKKKRLDDARQQAEKQAEEERKKEAEQKRLTEMENQRQQEQLQLEADMKQQREAQLAETARKQQEQEKRSKYNLLISDAEQASENKDYDRAEDKYNQALVLYPDDNQALAGKESIQKLINACDNAVGSWDWFHGGNTNIHADGTIDGTWMVFSNTGTWECQDPAKRLLVLRWKVGGWIDNLILSDDGNELKGKNQQGSDVSGIKK
ncbi:MAG: DNA segregation ATPase FtsK/SpoIIIE-like protein [Gammaproteobacteria bacterium]|jgi:DNA segregation ATPase FtsK/SpoIIIE-like protein